MDIFSYVKEELRRHPSAGPEDIVKLCYQAAYGAEHLLRDPDRARRRFDGEFRAAPIKSAPLCEAVSEEMARVDLGAWKGRGLPGDWLFGLFAAGARRGPGRPDVPDRQKAASPAAPSAGTEDAGESAEALFRLYLSEAGQVILAEKGRAAHRRWGGFLEAYIRGGAGALHHSAAYREAEAPCYRLVPSKYLRALSVLMKIRELQEKQGTVQGRPVAGRGGPGPAAGRPAEPLIIAIDGRAASGKTTLAEALTAALGAPAVHMDDFFLPADLRSEARYAEPGGNVHYERFAEEVLPYLRGAESFGYRIFDCTYMDYRGRRRIPAAPCRIVEGAYSLHPKFGDYAGLTVFSDISRERQTARIAARDGSDRLKDFRERWIPLEEKYFSAFGIRDGADIVL